MIYGTYVFNNIHISYTSQTFPMFFSGVALDKEVAILVHRYAIIRVDDWETNLEKELDKHKVSQRQSYLNEIHSTYKGILQRLPTDYQVSQYLHNGKDFLVIGKGEAPEPGFEYVPGDLQLAVTTAKENLTSMIAILKKHIDAIVQQTENQIITDQKPFSRTHPITGRPIQTDMLRIDDIIEHYGVSRSTIYQWRKKGLLTYTRVGKLVFVHKDDLLKLLHSNK